MIYYDVTEGRKGTRVPDAVLKICRPVENLERFTATDFMIDPFDDRPLPAKLLDIPPHMMALKDHAENGILLQRKSGRDFMSSVADLGSIQARMSVWSAQVWLVPVGVSHTNNQRVTAFGKSVDNWTWPQVQGAYNAWRLRGGSVACELKSEEELGLFLVRLDTKLREYNRDPSMVIAKKGHVQNVKLVDRNWLTTLSAWPPGVGFKRLLAVAKYIDAYDREPTLINVARAILSGQATKVKGWGKKTINDVRVWWGCDEDWPLDVIAVPLGKVAHADDYIMPHSQDGFPINFSPRRIDNDGNKESADG